MSCCSRCATGRPATTCSTRACTGWRRHHGLVVLVVEDVQWADDATLDLLRFLGRRVRTLPVLLLVTFRDDALAPTDPLRVALGELGGAPLHPADRPAPAHRRRGTPAGRGHVVRPGRAAPADRRQPVLRRRGAAAAAVPRCPRPRATPYSPGPRPSASRRGRRSRRPRSTASASTPTWSCRRPVPDSTPSTSWSRRACSRPTARPCGSGTSWPGARSSPRSAPHRRTAGHQALLAALIEEACDDDARMAYHAEGAGEAGPRASLRAGRGAPGRSAGSPPGGRLAVRAGPALPARRPARAGRAVRRVRRRAGARRPLAAGRRGRASARSPSGSELGDVRREGYDHRRLVARCYWRLCRGAESVAALQRAHRAARAARPRPRARARATAAMPSRSGATTRTAGRQMLARGAARWPTQVGDPSAAQRRHSTTSPSASYVLRRDWTRPMKRGAAARPRGRSRGPGRARATPTPTPSTPTSTGSPRASATGATASPTATTATSRRTAPACAATARSRCSTSGRWDEAARSPSGCWRTEASPVNLLTSQITLGPGPGSPRACPAPSTCSTPPSRRPTGLDEAEWVCATRLARAEARWLAGDDDGAVADLRRSGRDLADGVHPRRPAQRLGAAAPRHRDPGLARARSPGRPGCSGEHARGRAPGTGSAAAYDAALALPRLRLRRAPPRGDRPLRGARRRRRRAPYPAADEGPRPPRRTRRARARAPASHPPG